MKIRIVLSALFLTASCLAHGQAVPAGESSMSPSVGPSFATLDGVLHYALSASEILQFGYFGPGDVSYSTVFSGDVAYTAKSTTRPFSVLFAGGVFLPNQQGQGTSSFWDVSVNQGYVTRHWVFNVSDSFSFLPQSPTTGLSGVAGVGDLGAVPIQSPVEGPAGGVLTTSGDRIGNSVSGSVERQLNRETSISGTGSWAVLHFLGQNQSDGLDSTQVAGVVALNRRIDARSSVSVDAVYSTYSYGGSNSGFTEPDFQTRGLNVTYQRTLSRTLSVNGSIGPQWVSSSNSQLIPSMLDVAGSAGVAYSRRFVNASVTYFRGANQGSGVLPGAVSNSVTGSIGRSYGRDWVVSASGSYSHSAGLTQFTPESSALPSTEVYNTVFAGVQATRRISTHFSGYLSYTAQHQSTSSLVIAPNAFNGTSQTFGLGITFTPRATDLGQF